MAVVGALALVMVSQSYWLVNARRRPVDWWRIRVIKSQKMVGGGQRS
jgi:hypothetical protein